MATKTHIMLIDDVDGEEAVESIQFAVDGVTFEIDLSEKNAEALRDSFAQWCEAGRRTGGRHRVAAATRPMTRTTLPPQKAPITMTDRRAIQRFAKREGLRVPGDRGRISRDVVDAWEDAGRPAS